MAYFLYFLRASRCVSVEQLELSAEVYVCFPQSFWSSSLTYSFDFPGFKMSFHGVHFSKCDFNNILSVVTLLTLLTL